MKTFRLRIEPRLTILAVLLFGAAILGAFETPFYFGASNLVAWACIACAAVALGALLAWAGAKLFRERSFLERMICIAAWLLVWPVMTWALVVTVGRYSGLAAAGLWGLLISMVEFAFAAALARAVTLWTHPDNGKYALTRKVAWTVFALLGLGANFWAVTVIAGSNHTLVAATAGRELEAGVPAAPGVFAVRSFSYGSGTDIRRERYGSQIQITSRTVDGSAFVDSWAPAREEYWGFGLANLPLNATVWMPEAPVPPLPVVMIVHGDHDMRTANELGYTYLGELLASRGYFVASLDESFLNSAPFGYGPAAGENDLRAWLLLEHLRQLREWNAPEAPLARQLDLSRVLLIGHSRGGDAVAIATAFNSMSGYPEDTRVVFDYVFGIKGVLALAPIVGQYQPGGRSVVLENVSYLTLHGTLDGDVPSFMGLRQYGNVKPSETEFHLAEALYIAGANHAQFNQEWGSPDAAPPVGWLLDSSRLMHADDQRRIAMVYASLFADLVLRGERANAELLMNPEHLRGQLPQTNYWTRFSTSPRRVLADFEEDADPRTATAPDVMIEAEGMSVWKEQDVDLRTPEVFGSQGNRAAFLAWGTDKSATAARYQLASRIDRPLLNGITGADILRISLADARFEWWAPAGAEAQDLSGLLVSVVDGKGREATVPMSGFGHVSPTPRVRLTKLSALESESAEMALSTVSIPIHAFQTANARIDVGDIRTMSLRFDAKSSGAAILDDWEIVRAVP